MKIYAVIFGTDEEEISEVLSLFDSQEAAESEIARMQSLEEFEVSDSSEFDIVIYDLNAPSNI